MKISASFKSFSAFALLWFLIVGLMAVSSPTLYTVGSGILSLLAGAGLPCMALSTKLLQFPAEHGSVAAQSALGMRYASGKGVTKDVVLAKKWLTQAAGNCDCDAQQTLAQLYLFGDDQSQRGEALKWLNKGAAQDSAVCQSMLSFMYLYGLGVKQDLTQAFSWCERAANNHEAASESELSKYFQYGLGTKRDDKATSIWSEKAAKQGITSAQFRLAISQISGQGVKQDLPGALHWLETAAKHGDFRAQTLLGLIFHFHLFGKNDPDLATRYLTTSAQQGSSVATYLKASPPGSDSTAVKQLEEKAERGDAHAAAALGEMYATGCGEKRDDQKAFAWYSRAAAKGDVDAQTRLGSLYFQGAIGCKPDFAQASRWFKQAASGGNSEAQYWLGRGEMYGTGFELNRKDGMALLQKSAELGNVDGQFSYARIFALGEGVPPDEKRALEWLRRAALKGDARAQNRLAELKVSDDDNWRQKAAEQGYGPALRYLGNAYLVGITTKQDVAKGTKILNDLANDGDCEAACDLAGYCRFGIFGVPEDKPKAAKLYEKPAADGNIEALIKLGDMYRMGDLGDEKKDQACKWYAKAADEGSPEGLEKMKKHCAKGKLQQTGDDAM